MTDAKIRAVLNRYEEKCTDLIADAEPKSKKCYAGDHTWCHNRNSDESHCRCACHRHDPQIHHLLGMTPKMREMLVLTGREKLMRWLGFMQGVLWTKGVYTVDELRAHNMPDGEEFRPRG